VEFVWKRGKWVAVDSPLEFDLIAKTEDNNFVSLNQLSCSTASEMLGIWMAPKGSKTKIIQEMRTSTVEWGAKIRKGRPSHEEAWQALHFTIAAKLKYPLAACTFTERECTSIMAPPQSTVEVRISWIIFVLHPLGAIQIPSISDAVLQDNRFNETKLLSSVFAIKSNSSGASAATYFQRFHKNSTRYQYVLSEANAPPETSISTIWCYDNPCGCPNFLVRIEGTITDGATSPIMKI
jgi:hypothetical protein